MTGEKARNVLEEDGGRSNIGNEIEEGEGEPRSRRDLALDVGRVLGVVIGLVVDAEASALAGDAEVLAWEAGGPEGGSWNTASDPVPSSVCASSETPIPFAPVIDVRSESGDIPEVGDSGPSLGEDGRGVRVDLGEADGSESGPFEPQIETADA